MNDLQVCHKLSLWSRCFLKEYKANLNFQVVHVCIKLKTSIQFLLPSLFKLICSVFVLWSIKHKKQVLADKRRRVWRHVFLVSSPAAVLCNPLNEWSRWHLLISRGKSGQWVTLDWRVKLVTVILCSSTTSSFFSSSLIDRIIRSPPTWSSLWPASCWRRQPISFIRFKARSSAPWKPQLSRPARRSKYKSLRPFTHTHAISH